MIRLMLSAALIFGATTAMANELDNESGVTNQRGLQGTMVVRVDKRTNSVGILKSTGAPASAQEAHAMAVNGKFDVVAANHVKSELDRDGGASSWYFYGGYYGYNPYSYLNYYGNYYQPCYSYSYSYYNYYYYSPYQYRWW